MRRWLIIPLLFAACGSNQSLEHDLDPILLSRAPVQPGGAKLGGLWALVGTQSGLRPLLVDTAFPLDSLARGECPSSGPPGWTYTGTMELHDSVTPTAPLRAAFGNVGLFDICPGASGDPSVQPVGVMGGPLLTNFSVGFAFPASEIENASMTLWPSYPGTDDQLGQDGQVVLHFDARGNIPVAQGNGEASLTLPSSRVVLAACAGARQFSTSEPVEACAQGEAALRASGEDVMLAIGTGEGPLILSQTAWSRLAGKLGIDANAGTQGPLHTPFEAVPVPALFATIPRLAIFQGTTDNSWLGPCTELARARRIEAVLANQDAGACFQPCDANEGQAASTRPYIDLGGALAVAVVSETSDLILSLNADVATKPRVDGIIGAATLAGVRLRIDYTAQPQARAIASCLQPGLRDTCFAAPSCPGLSEQGEQHTCFGQQPRGYAPVCTQ